MEFSIHKLPAIKKNHASLLWYFNVVLLALFATACGVKPGIPPSAYASSDIDPTPVISPIIEDGLVINTFKQRAAQLCPILMCSPNLVMQNLHAVHGFSNMGNLAETTDNGIDVFTADPRINAKLLESVATQEIINFSAVKKPAPPSWGFSPGTANIQGTILSYNDMSEIELSDNVNAQEVVTNSLGQQLHREYPSIPYYNPSHQRGGSLLIDLFTRYNIPLSRQIEMHINSDIETVLSAFGMKGLEGYKTYISTLNYMNSPAPTKLRGETVQPPTSVDKAIQYMQRMYKSLRNN